MWARCYWNRYSVLHGAETGAQLVKKFPAFYDTRRFIAAFTSVRHLTLSWASSIQCIPPHPTSRRFILISSSHLSLSLPSASFPQFIIIIIIISSSSSSRFIYSLISQVLTHNLKDFLLILVTNNQQQRHCTPWEVTTHIPSRAPDDGQKSARNMLSIS